jgi:hypothetical protein
LGLVSWLTRSNKVIVRTQKQKVVFTQKQRVALLRMLFLLLLLLVTDAAPPSKRARVLVIGVISALENVDRRNAIRRTWGQLLSRRDIEGVVDLRFVVGEGNSTAVSDIDFVDLLRVPVRDSYRNVIHKVLHFCSWACQHFEFDFLMKSDDDAFVALPWLLMALAKLSSRYQVYLGHFWTGPPIRDANHRNSLPSSSYPFDALHPYAHGASYILSADLVSYIQRNERTLLPGLLPGGNVEDIQVGLWLFSLGVVPRHDHRFSDYLHCHRNSIVLFDLSPALMAAAWHQFLVASTEINSIRIASQSTPSFLPPLPSPQPFLPPLPSASTFVGLCAPAVRRAALQLMQDRFATSPQPSLLNTMAVSHALLGEYTQAEAMLKHALALSPAYIVAKANLEYLQFVLQQDLVHALDTASSSDAVGGLHGGLHRGIEAFDGGIEDASKSISVPYYAQRMVNGYSGGGAYYSFRFIRSEEPNLLVAEEGAAVGAAEGAEEGEEEEVEEERRGAERSGEERRGEATAISYQRISASL